MAIHQIRDGVGFCRFEGRTIALDLAADRYWQFGDRLGDALEAILGGRGEAIESATLDRLMALGLIVEAGQPGAVPDAGATLPPAARSAIETPAEAEVGWSSLCEVAMLLVIARIALRWRPLMRLVDRQPHRAPVAAIPLSFAADARIARRFMGCRRLVPLRPLCLADSLAFLWFARRRRRMPFLVFGVEAFPFTAHCWVQQGDMVLNDALDHASRFRRILVR